MMLKKLCRFLLGTLRGRLIMGVAAVHAVMMTLFIGDLTVRQRAMLLDRQKEEAAGLSQAVATSAAGWLAAEDISGLQELVDAQLRYPEILFAILADQEGRVLADTDRSKLGLYMLDLPRESRLTVVSGTPSLVDVAAPAMIGGRYVGWARVGIGHKAADEKLAEITRDGAVYALAAILIGSVIAWFMGHRISRRLYAVQETIDAVRSGNLLARSPLEGADEAAVMAREFNSMLDALAGRDVELRASEERYRSLIQKVQTAIVVHDGQGRILISNPMAQELLGLSADQLLGKPLVDPEWHFLREDGSVMPVAEYSVSLVLSRRQPLRGRVTGISRPDRDDVVWMLGNAEPEYDAAGEIALVIVSFLDITERKRAEEALRESETLHRSVITAMADGMVLQTAHGEITALNPAAETIEGRSAGQMLGHDSHDPQWRAVHEDGSPFPGELHPAMVTLRTGEPQKDVVMGIYKPDGTLAWISINSQPLIADGASTPYAVVTTFHDITERKLAEESLRRLNRELRALSHCNQLLVRAEDEQTLIHDICCTVCDEAGYRMAWVGYAENDEARTIRTVAWAGVEDGYLSNANITWADTERGRGPTGTAIRDGETIYVQDFATDPRMDPWRDNALQRGYRSSIALPLKDEVENTFGALTIYSARTDAFTADEIVLMEEMAGDLAFGIMTLRARKERALAWESLHKLTEELEQRVADRTAELNAKNEELERLNRLFVGRELRMVELKERISQLEKMLEPETKRTEPS
jgi:PAS domain S-box-containing protein